MSAKPLTLAVRSSISVLLIGWLLRKFDLSLLISMLQGADFFFLALCLLMPIPIIGFSVLKWQVLLRSKGVHVSLGRLTALYVIGYFFNNFLPSNVGGDIVRAHELGSQTGQKAEAFASVFMERFTGLTMLVLFSAVSFAINLGIFKDPHFSLSLGAVIIAYGALLWFTVDPNALRHLDAWPLKHVLPARIRTKLQHMQAAVLDYKLQKRALVHSLLLSALFYTSTIFNVEFAALTFHQPIALLDLMRIVPMIFVVAMLPIGVGGIGLTEWAYVLTFQAIGQSGHLGLTVALLMRAKSLVIGLMGGAIYAFGASQPSSAAARTALPSESQI